MGLSRRKKSEYGIEPAPPPDTLPPRKNLSIQEQILAAREERLARERLRRKCHRIADEFGCRISVHRSGVGRSDLTITYWLKGPSPIYESPDYWSGIGTGVGVSARPDPLQGDHSSASWGEVLDKLEVYQEDLVLHWLGLQGQSPSAAALRSSPLWEPWWRNPDEPDRGLVLADWLEDQGNPDFAAEIRARAKWPMYRGGHSRSEGGEDTSQE